MIDAAFVPNPAYGAGIFRRRIRLLSTTGRVTAGLEDNYHAMECGISHEGGLITAVDARTLRIPMSTCPGATAPLQALVGRHCTAELLLLYRQTSPQLNCTHLLDLACLAIAQAARGIGTRQYDVEIPDERDAPAAAVVMRDGEIIHAWQGFAGRIVGPQRLAGRPLVAGFMRWATQEFSGEALEAAMVLHKSAFVSNARRFITDDAWLLEPSEERTMQGVCHTYQPGNVQRAIRLRNVARDFTNDADKLLSWFGDRVHHGPGPV